MNCEPANTIINRLGIDAIAEACGVHKSRVYRWRAEKDVGGTGGTIPQTHHLDILELAHRKCVGMSAMDLLPKRKPAVSSPAGHRQPSPPPAGNSSRRSSHA